MAGDRRDEWIVVTEDAKTLPVIEILTGRGFITGKSGSGKSNTASVIAEELLEREYGLLIIDTEGEYYGLKEEFEMLHVGADDHCDEVVAAEDGHEIAVTALEGNVPVVLDVSGYFDADDAEAVIESVVTELYQLEKDVRKPFLLMVEEMQEYLPQTGGSTDLAALLERVAKRGRKRGLGICGMSQRPSSVDKDFITQCDWMVWHRLTWETDLNVVRNILGSEKATAIQDFEAGEGILMTDWDDTVERVKFKRKRTLDAGATPGLDRYEQGSDRGAATALADAASDQLSSLDVITTSANGSSDRTSGDDIGIETFDLEDEDGTDIEPDSLEAEELVEAYENEHRRAEVLAAEVEELRSILRTVDQQGSDSGRSRSRPQQTGRPQPPPRPADRDGVAGSLIELTQLVTYTARLVAYHLRLTMYRLRST